MRVTFLWIFLVLFAVTIFTLSNLQTVTLTFWQWPVYTGPLSLAVMGAVILGVLLAYLPSLLHHSRQGRRIRSLEERVKGYEAQVAVPETITLSPTPGAVPRVHIVDKEGRKL